jgi:hypothetical protein
MTRYEANGGFLTSKSTLQAASNVARRGDCRGDQWLMKDGLDGLD